MYVYIYIYICMYRYMYMYAYAGFCYRVSLNGQGSRLQPWMLWPSTPRNDFSHSLRHSPASLCPWLAMWELFPSGSCTCLGFRAFGLGFTLWLQQNRLVLQRVLKKLLFIKIAWEPQQYYQGSASSLAPSTSFLASRAISLNSCHLKDLNTCDEGR